MYNFLIKFINFHKQIPSYAILDPLMCSFNKIKHIINLKYGILWPKKENVTKENSDSQKSSSSHPVCIYIIYIFCDNILIILIINNSGNRLKK